MARQTETGHVRHGMYTRDVAERSPGFVEAHHVGCSGLEVLLLHQALLLVGGHHAHTEGLGQKELVSHLGAAIPLQTLDGHAPRDGQTEDGFW